MLRGAKRYAQLHSRAQRLLRENKLHAAAALYHTSATDEARGLMAHAYAHHFRAWLDMRLRRCSYNGELVDSPYDVLTAPRETPRHL